MICDFLHGFDILIIQKRFWFSFTEFSIFGYLRWFVDPNLVSGHFSVFCGLNLTVMIIIGAVRFNSFNQLKRLA
jgi:hypothetical protein